jgi:hypothetical protein
LLHELDFEEPEDGCSARSAICFHIEVLYCIGELKTYENGDGASTEHKKTLTEGT